MRAAVGTLAWLERTGGILSRRDRVDFLGQAVAYGFATLPGELRRALRIGRQVPAVDLGLIAPPDSAVVRTAERLIAEIAPPMVANHCHRTYAMGAALAQLDHLQFDAEVVYVASLLHDLHFADPRALPQPHCFTLPAVRRTRALLTENGWDERRRELTAEAISLHLNVRPPRTSVEAYVVYAGARLDVAAYRYGDVHPDTMAAIVEQHPRLDLKRKSAPMFTAQSAANRGSRADFYTRFLAVNLFTRRTPFLE